MSRKMFYSHLVLSLPSGFPWDSAGFVKEIFPFPTLAVYW